MKKSFTLILSLIILLTLFSCAKPKILENESSDSNQTSKIEPYSYETKVVLFNLGNNTYKAVTNDGKIIDFLNLENNEIRSGYWGEKLNINVDANNNEKIDFKNSYTETALSIVNTTKEDAPQKCAKQLLDEFVGRNYECQIFGYTINEVKVTNTQNDGRIDFSFKFDLEVAGNANGFAEYSPYSTKYGEGRTIKNITKEVTILGTNDLWALPSDFYPTSKYTTHEISSSFFKPKENQTLIFETQKVVFYSEKTFLALSEKDKELGLTKPQHDTSLWCLNKSDNNKTVLVKNKRNFDFNFLDYVDGKIYFTPWYWVPASEGFPSDFICFDENNMKTETINGSYVYFILKDMVYFERIINEKPVLHSLNLKTKEVKKICDFNYSYMDLDHPYIKDNKIHFQTQQQKVEIDLLNGKVITSTLS